jgi:hypothetical protein
MRSIGAARFVERRGETPKRNIRAEDAFPRRSNATRRRALARREEESSGASVGASTISRKSRKRKGRSGRLGWMARGRDGPTATTVSTTSRGVVAVAVPCCHVWGAALDDSSTDRRPSCCGARRRRTVRTLQTMPISSRSTGETGRRPRDLEIFQRPDPSPYLRIQRSSFVRWRAIRSSFLSCCRVLSPSKLERIPFQKAAARRQEKRRLMRVRASGELELGVGSGRSRYRPSTRHLNHAFRKPEMWPIIAVRGCTVAIVTTVVVESSQEVGGAPSRITSCLSFIIML